MLSQITVLSKFQNMETWGWWCLMWDWLPFFQLPGCPLLSSVSFRMPSFLFPLLVGHWLVCTDICNCYNPLSTIHFYFYFQAPHLQFLFAVISVFPSQVFSPLCSSSLRDDQYLIYTMMQMVTTYCWLDLSYEKAFWVFFFWSISVTLEMS